MPARLAAGRALLRQRLRGDERHVRDRREPAARVALRSGVRAQLLEVHGADAGLLAQLALGRLLGRLVGADEAARQREHAALGLLQTAGEQDAQAAVDEREDDRVGGEPDRGVVLRGVARRDPLHTLNYRSFGDTLTACGAWPPGSRCARRLRQPPVAVAATRRSNHVRPRASGRRCGPPRSSGPRSLPPASAGSSTSREGSSRRAGRRPPSSATTSSATGGPAWPTCRSRSTMPRRSPIAGACTCSADTARRTGSPTRSPRCTGTTRGATAGRRSRRRRPPAPRSRSG